MLRHAAERTNKRRVPRSAKSLRRIYASTPDLRFWVCDSIPGGGLYCTEKAHAVTGRSPVVARCCLPASRPRPIRWPTNRRCHSATSSTNEPPFCGCGRHLAMPPAARTLSRHASKVGSTRSGSVRWERSANAHPHRDHNREASASKDVRDNLKARVTSLLAAPEPAARCWAARCSSSAYTSPGSHSARGYACC